MLFLETLYHLEALALTEVILGGFLTWFSISTFVTWFRLRHVPGPWMGSFSYLWMIRNTWYGTCAEENIRLKKYGSLVRVGPNYLLTDDPAVVRHINSARNGYHRDPWYKGTKFDAEQDHVFSLLDTPAHDKLKARVANGYNGRDNVDLERGVDDIVQKLIATIRGNHLSAPGAVKEVELVYVIRYFTLDVITRLGYGQEFGFMNSEVDLYGFASSLEQFSLAITIITDVPLLRWLATSPYSPIQSLMLAQPTDKQGLGKIMKRGIDVVNKRYENNEKDHRDILGSFIRHGLTRKEVAAEVIIQLLAGSDTTATAIRTAMLYIMTTPHVYRKLKDLVKEEIEKKNVSLPITVEQAKKIPYLQAIIYESIRMRSPAVYGHFKMVPKGGDTINGIFLPEGTAIGVNYSGITRWKKVFGSDVELFRPERFLECNNETRIEMERTVEMVFGIGRFMCAGKQVVFAELNKIFFELFRNFDFQLVYPGKAWKEKSYAVWVHNDMLVRISEAA